MRRAGVGARLAERIRARTGCARPGTGGRPKASAAWSTDPFAGAETSVDGADAVRGRGALDDKGPLAVVLEAVENLLAAGVTPAHDVWIALGRDEEVMGSDARAMSAVLKERLRAERADPGAEPWLVLDEGGAVVSPSGALAGGWCMAEARRAPALLRGGLGSLVGFPSFVEFTSGVLPGYYTPLLTDIARHLGVDDADVNWLEGVQLMPSAMVVPALSKVGDLVGRRCVLVRSTTIALGASWPWSCAPCTCCVHGIDPARPAWWGSVLMLLAGAWCVRRFIRAERHHPDPVTDVRSFADPALWPVFATAGLFGVSVLGAQAPLSTYARTDPGIYGYGLGATGSHTSLIIGVYLVAMVAGPSCCRCCPGSSRRGWSW